MSSTSSSCRTGPSQCGHFVMSSRLTMMFCGGSHSSQYHTGMRCPHQSCREMFQSRMFVEPVHVHRLPPLGQDADRAVADTPRAPARRAAPSSRTTDPRDAARPPCRSGSSAARRAGALRVFCSAPDARSSSTIVSRASKRSSPLIDAGTRPSASVTSRIDARARRSRSASAASAACPPRSRSRRAPA